MSPGQAQLSALQPSALEPRRPRIGACVALSHRGAARSSDIVSACARLDTGHVGPISPALFKDSLGDSTHA